MTKLLSPLRSAWGMGLAGLLALGLGAALTTAHADEALLDPRAVERLERMSEVLGKAQALSLKARSLYDQVELSGVKIKRAVTQEIALKRPDRLYFRTSRDDGKVREGRYDGKALTIIPEGGGAYARIEAPGGIDAMLDLIQADYQVNVPVADLLYGDLYGRVKDFLISGVHLGTRTVDGETLDHLSFETTGADWQLWLEQGDRPLPRRVVVTFVNSPGGPEYLTVISDWKLDQDPGQVLSPVEPPAGWQRIEIPKVPPPGSQ